MESKPEAMEVEQQAVSSRNLFVDDIFSHANPDLCRDAKNLLDELPRNIPDSGWWILSRIKQNQLCAKFDHNSEKAKSVFGTVMQIIDRYYVNAKAHLNRICREENVPEYEALTCSNERVVSFRNKYANAISQDEYICLDIPLSELSTALVNLNSLIVGLSMISMRFHSASIANAIQHSTHVPLLIPFNHSTDLLFSKFVIKPNLQFLSMAKSDPNADLSKTPYMFVSGYVALICDTAESKGTNTAGKKFKVLNIVEPSMTILREHLNNYIRRLYPDSFPAEKMSPNLFVQLSETQSTPNVSCIEPHRGKRFLLVFANLANIFLVQSRGSVVPQLQIWTNVKLGD